MALALLREEDGDGQARVFEIDTGTSPYFRVLLGTQVRTVDGVVVLDGPYWRSEWRRNPRAGRHLDTRTRYLLEESAVTEPRSLVQVQSAAAPDGRAPAFSRPVRLGAFVDAPGDDDRVDAWGSAPESGFAMSASSSEPAPVGAPGAAPMPRSARTAVATCSARETYSRPASMDDLLGTLVRVAGPVLQQLLGPGGAGGASGTGGDASALSPDTLAQLLRSVLGAVASPATGAAAAAPVSPVPAPSATAPATADASAAHAAPAPAALGADLFATPHDPVPAGGDLFATPESMRIDWGVAPARAMIAGIDDAILAGLAGSVLSALPQLVNAAAAQRAQRRTDHLRLVTEVLGSADRMRLLQLLAAAAPGGGGATGAASGGDGAATGAAGSPGGESVDAIEELRRLLGAAPAVAAPSGTPAAAAAPAASAAAPPAASTGPAPGAVSGTSSLDGTRTTTAATTATASRAVLAPVLAPPLPRLGGPRPVFAAGQAVTLRFRLDVGTDGPTTPLPRAVLDVAIGEPGGSTRLVERTQRLTGLAPGTPISVALTPAELAALPHEVDLEVTASLRWPGRSSVYQASSATRIVLGAVRSVRARGGVAGEPRELTDMARFRSFWNRVWASTDADDGELPLWGFDAATRYSVVLTAADRGNGLMQTRSELRPQGEGVRRLTAGRFKAGLEVSVHELNALLPLWEGGQPLAPEVVAAFAAPAWLAAQGGDAVANVRFEGRRNTRGVLWAVPVLGLRSFTLASATEVDPYGQVLATADEEVRFPVIEAVRLLGLAASVDEESAEPTASGYAFDGYEVVFETKAGLEPASAVIDGSA
ncbi:hypothetical protein [Agromyces sp. NPDC055658]